MRDLKLTCSLAALACVAFTTSAAAGFVYRPAVPVYRPPVPVYRPVVPAYRPVVRQATPVYRRPAAPAHRATPAYRSARSVSRTPVQAHRAPVQAYIRPTINPSIRTVAPAYAPPPVILSPRPQLTDHAVVPNKPTLSAGSPPPAAIAAAKPVPPTAKAAPNAPAATAATGLVNAHGHAVVVSALAPGRLSLKSTPQQVNANAAKTGMRPQDTGACNEANWTCGGGGASTPTAPSHPVAPWPSQNPQQSRPSVYTSLPYEYLPKRAKVGLWMGQTYYDSLSALGDQLSQFLWNFNQELEAYQAIATDPELGFAMPALPPPTGETALGEGITPEHAEAVKEDLEKGVELLTDHSVDKLLHPNELPEKQPEGFEFPTAPGEQTNDPAQSPKATSDQGP